ncbi:MAG: hypothetical protein H7Z42_17165 [Roseiflexaceae bacterium]|nr:hypothetical protein [Roseiflexaceae bacterium]
MMQSQSIRLAGIACIVGGSLLTILEQLPAGVAGNILTTLMQLGLACGPLGLLWLHAFGSGKLKIIGWVGSGLTWLGLTLLLAGTVSIALYPAQEFEQLFTPIGTLLAGIGMCVVSVVVAVACRLPGWRSLAALSVGFYYPIMIPLQIIFRISQGLEPLYVLIMLWGVPWMLLGLAILRSAPQAQPNVQPIRFV